MPVFHVQVNKSKTFLFEAENQDELVAMLGDGEDYTCNAIVSNRIPSHSVIGETEWAFSDWNHPTVWEVSKDNLEQKPWYKSVTPAKEEDLN